MTSPVRVAPRCAVHPARLAVDACPVCGRDRCGVDATHYADRGCAACAGAGGRAVPPAALEVVVRAGLAAMATLLVGGWIATEHVNVHITSLVAPALLGLAASGAAAGASGAQQAGQGRLVLLVATVAALLGTALGFRLFGEPVTPVHPWHQVWLPYVAALGGVAAWPLLFGAAGRARPERQPAGGAEIRSNR
jgi:hypothetical protein